jgi:hypothetical protein
MGKEEHTTVLKLGLEHNVLVPEIFANFQQTPASSIFNGFDLYTYDRFRIKGRQMG